MPKLFMCCKGCKPPKRSPMCHSTCWAYLKDRAELDRLNAEEQKEKRATQYVMDLVNKASDIEAKQQQRSRRHTKANKV